MAMTLRLTDEENEALRRTAEREHRSMQDVARDAINRYTSDRDALRAQALERIGSEWRETFTRLRDEA